jgi:hypothetical protein
LLWSAALSRRFCFFSFHENVTCNEKNKSGGKAPHSKEFLLDFGPASLTIYSIIMEVGLFSVPAPLGDPWGKFSGVFHFFRANSRPNSPR